MPNSKVLEIVNYCNSLCSTKITEQAKGLSGLQLLVADYEAVESLNDCGNSKKGTTWNSVFHFLFEYFQKECETLSRQHGSWADTTRKNKIKKLQDLFNFMKTFIRIANNGTIRLKIVQFLDFLIGLWQNSIFVTNYGTTILKILSENVLEERKYSSEMSKHTFDVLFRICGEELLLLEEKRKFTISALFLSLTRSLVHQMDAHDCLHLYTIFLDCAKSLKLVKSSGVRDNILAALNFYINWCSVTHRYICCQLGEETLDIILRTWMDGLPTDGSSTLNLLTEFCSTQISLHHPGLAVEESEGYYVNDATRWHRQLYSILLAADMQLAKQQSGLLYRVKDEKGIQFSESCIKLAAVACSVLFQLVFKNKFEGTPLPSGNTTSNLISKIDFKETSSLLSIFTIEKDKRITESAKPWLQILNSMVREHYKIFNFTVLMKIAAKFRSLFLNASIDSLGGSGINLMDIIFNQLVKRFPDEVQSHREELAGIWKDCWTVASSCLTQTARTAIVHAALKFLTTLIKFDASCKTDLFTTTGVVKSAHNMWSSLYLHITPNNISLQLVLAFMEVYGLNCMCGDNAVFSTLLQTTAKNTEFSECSTYYELINKDPLKVLLLHWLLGYKEEVVSEKHSRSTAASQMNPHDANPPKSMILLNLLPGKLNRKPFESQENIETVSLILALLCHKNSPTSNISPTESRSEMCLDDIVAKFLDPTFVAKYKYFSSEEDLARLNLEPDKKRSTLCLSKPLLKSAVLVVFHSLQHDLGIITETILDAKKEKIPSRFPKLSRSFFTFAYIAGKFLKFVLGNDTESIPARSFFEYWLQKIVEATETILSSMEKWANLNSDKDFMSALFEDAESLVFTFYGLEPVINQDVFTCAKAIFESSTNAICEKALTVLKSSVAHFETPAVTSNGNSSLFSVDSHDDTLGLTQSVTTNPGSSGYKRRRYGAGDAPPSKQKRVSSREDSNSSQMKDSSDGSKSSSHDVFVTNPLHDRALSFMCTMCNHADFGNHLRDALKLISDLDYTSLQELKIIYLILNRLSTVYKKLSLEEMCDVAETFQEIFRFWYRDQYISMKFLALLANFIDAFTTCDAREQMMCDLLIEKAADVLGVFWGFKTDKKCSFLVRMGIAVCLVAILKKKNGAISNGDSGIHEEFCFSETKDAVSGLLSFLSDSHDGVKFLTTKFMKITFSAKRDNTSFGALQEKVLPMISENVQQFFSENAVAKDEHAENHLSFLSVSLRTICAILPHSSKRIEEQVHYQLCLIAEGFAKITKETTAKDVVLNVILKSLRNLAENAAVNMLDTTDSGKNVRPRYINRHLAKVLHNWMERSGGDVFQALELFPFQLFHAKSMHVLCFENKKETFPVLFSLAKSVSELEKITRIFFLPETVQQLDKGFLKQIISECVPRIFALHLPMKPLPENVSVLLNGVFQKQTATIELGALHLGRILVEVLLNTVARGVHDLNTTLDCLVKFCQPMLKVKGSKSKQQNIRSLIPMAIFTKHPNGCQLVDVFLCLREHFCKAQYPSDLNCITTAYKHLILLLLKDQMVPDDFAPYFLKEVIYTVALHASFVPERFEKTLANSDKDLILNVGVSCTDVMISVCEFLKTSTSTVIQRAAQNWIFAVPIANSAATLQHFCCNMGEIEHESQCGLRDILKKRLDKLTSLARSLGKSEVLQTLLNFCVVITDNEITEDVFLCMETLDNSFTVLEDHNLLENSNRLLGNICKNLANALSYSGQAVKSSISSPKLWNVASHLLRMMHLDTSRIPAVFDCVVEVFALLPKDSHLNKGEDSKPENAQDLTKEILEILSQLVVSGSFEISEDAAASLFQLLQLPIVGSCWEVIQTKNRLLADFLTTFKIDATPSPRDKLEQRGIEDLKNIRFEEYILAKPYQEWVCQFTSTLVDFCSNDLLRILKTVCAKVAKLSSLLLPFVVHDILVNDPTHKARTALSSYIQTAFETFMDAGNKSACTAVRTMQALLDVVQFLRTQKISEIQSTLRNRGKSNNDTNSTVWDNNFWLDISYLTASNVAVACERPYMAILFSEIWTEMSQSTEIEVTVKTSRSSTCRSLLSALDGPSENDNLRRAGCDDSEKPKHLQKSTREKILIKAYSEINDVDSLHSLCEGCTDDSQLMMRIHEKERNWGNALGCYSDIMDKTPSSVEVPNKILSSLKYSGLEHIGEMYRKGTQFQFAESTQRDAHNWLSEKQFEAACKVGKWDEAIVHKSTIGSQGINFNSKLFECISCLNDEDMSLMSLVSDAQNDIAFSIAAKLPESSILNGEMLSGICCLVILKEIEDAHHLIIEKNPSAAPKVLGNWEKFSVCGSESVLLDSYDSADRVMSNRHCLLTVLMTKFKGGNSTRVLDSAIERNQMAQITLATNDGREKLALKMIGSLKRKILPDDNPNLVLPFKYFQVALQEVELLWDLGRKAGALSAAKSLQTSLQTSITENSASKWECGFLLGKILRLQGQWLNDTKMKGPSVIMENYFKKSAAIADGLRQKKLGLGMGVTTPQIEELCVSGFKSLAKFADAQYRQIIDYMRSNEFEQKRNLVREAKEEIKRAQSKSGLAQNQKYVILLQKNYKMDHKDFDDILTRKEEFLLCALENYVKCLKLTDEDDILMYRVCSLWFSNTQSQSLPGLMECACKDLKTHKFVEMSYQLAARLNAGPTDKIFQNTLENLLFRVAIEHPHHILPVLFALANAHRDAELVKSSSKRSSIQGNTDPTSISARSIVKKVKAARPKLVSMMGDLSDAYIQFANWDVSRFSKTTGTPISFEKNLLINKYCGDQLGEEYSALAVPTVEIPICKNGRYEDEPTFVSLRSFKKYFKLCGGINLPKIVVAIGSDGTERKHLVKGRDDLRQDSVMEQVFKVVNALLTKEKGSSGLKLRTYKVVPLSQRSGLVEWCEGTLPIGNYLIGVPVQKDFGAHHRYRPKDSFSFECRKKLSSASGKPLHQKLSTYKEICTSFKPIFRHFFYENFTEPMSWFQSRNAYCKSVAASSIVGYILGLGDRHVQNILIDCASGEVIHIDLGVAFEQGKCLPTPEMVPFRLTRDMIDGFGSSGVEGVFRRNCEHTLSVLRKSIETISTIVEVLLHDPLHDWMMTSGKALQLQRHSVANAESEMTSSVLNASTVAELLQNETSGATTAASRSSLAGRALLRVQEKLRGLESGSVLSVEGQANLLIQQATDEERLCAMYAGWQPYI